LNINLKDGRELVLVNENKKRLRKNFLKVYLDLLGAIGSFAIPDAIRVAHYSPAYHILETLNVDFDMDTAADDMIEMCAMDYYLSLPPGNPHRSKNCANVDTLVGPAWKKRYDLVKVAEAVDSLLLSSMGMRTLEVYTTMVKLTCETAREPKVPELCKILIFLEKLKRRKNKYKKGAHEFELDSFDTMFNFLVSTCE